MDKWHDPLTCYACQFKQPIHNKPIRKHTSKIHYYVIKYRMVSDRIYFMEVSEESEKAAMDWFIRNYREATPISIYTLSSNVNMEYTLTNVNQ